MCKVQVHRQHKVIDLEDKIAEIRDNLEDALKEAKADMKAITKRAKELIKGQADVEKSTQEATEQMRHQLNDITGILASAYSKQVTIMKDTKRKQLVRFNKEADLLSKMGQKKKNFSDHVQTLLDQQPTDGFVNLAKTVLQKKSTEHCELCTDKWWERSVYQPPEFDKDEFLDYAERNLLGHFKVELALDKVPKTTDEKVVPEITISRQDSANEKYASPSVTFSSSSSSHVTNFTALTKEDVEMSLNKPEATKRPRLSSYSRSRSTSHSEDEIPLQVKINVKGPHTANLRKIFDVQFTTDAMWMCGWNKRVIGKNKTLLAKVYGRSNSVMLKKKMAHPQSSMPTVMTCSGNMLLIARKEGNEIFSFDTNSCEFSLKHKEDGLCLASICVEKENIYLIDSKIPGYIRILDNNFHSLDTIKTGLKNAHTCELDLCLIPNVTKSNGKVIIVSRSAPNGSVSAVNEEGEILWEINDSTFDKKPQQIFDPCSIASCEKGTIYVADRTRNKVSRYNALSSIFK